MQSSPRFLEALNYACRLHSSQRRKGSDVPYVAHLLSVAALVLEHGGNEDEAIAALLHDAVEDQGGAATAAEIVNRFGPNVAAIVEGCTDTDQEPKPAWQARKEAHLSRLAAASRSVQLVIAADKLHNVRSLIADYRLLGESLWQLFSGGRQGTLWYYRAASQSLSHLHGTPLVAELDRALDQLDRLAASGRDEPLTQVS